MADCARSRDPWGGDCQGAYAGIVLTVNLLIDHEKKKKLSNKNSLPEL
jgi:hypothetical protein